MRSKSRGKIASKEEESSMSLVDGIDAPKKGGSNIMIEQHLHTCSCKRPNEFVTSEAGFSLPLRHT